MSPIDLSGITDDLVRTLANDLNLSRRFEGHRDNDDEDVPPNRLREALADFAESHGQAERTLARLVLKHLGISRNVFFDVSEDQLDDVEDSVHSSPPPPPPPPALANEDIIPALPPVPWLSEKSWMAMPEKEKVEFLDHAMHGMFRSPYTKRKGRFYPRPSLFKQNFVRFGRGIDRVVLGHGPRRVLVSVGVHGNEPCGVEAVRLLLERHALFRGDAAVTAGQLNEEGRWTNPLEDLFAHLTIEFIVGNPRAIDRRKRFLRRNLNRLLDAHILCDDERAREGGYRYELQRARLLAESIRNSDCILDVHSCSADVGSFALPSSSDVSEELAEALPVRFVVESLAHRTFEGGTTLDCALLHGVPGTCVECGQHSHPDVVARAAAVISSFLLTQCGDNGRASAGQDAGECSRPIVMRCESAERVEEGFQWLQKFEEFHFIPFGMPVFKDNVRGEVRCPVEEGAYLVMPTEHPIVGEEALFWATGK